MNVSLTPELEQFVQHRIRSGRYTSASEVVRESLRLLEKQEQLEAMHMDEMRRKIAEGLASLKRGEAISGDQAFAELRAMLHELREKD